MKLYVNDTEIGFSANSDDTIQHLLKAVEKQLDHDLIISDMNIDGTYYPMDDPKILSILVSQIEIVKLSVNTRTDLIISLLDEGIQLIEVGSTELLNGSVLKHKEIISSLAWIIESLDAITASVPFPPTEMTLIRADLSYLIKQLDECNNITLEEIIQLGRNLKGLILYMKQLQEKISNISAHSKESVFHKLQETQQSLPDLAYLFQTGKDFEAMQKLCGVIDTIEMFTRYTASIPEDKKLEGQAIALKDLSAQLLQAFEQKDFILIADIIEYDLSEQIDDILDLS
ncbi:MAG: hypothetical protein ACRCTQ_04430 [Brevinemataceae bacterium]